MKQLLSPAEIPAFKAKPKKAPAEHDRLLTNADVASILNVHPRTVARLLASGALPSVAIGSCRRVSADALQQFIASRK